MGDVHRGRAAALTLTLALAACSGGDASENADFEVTDSAGVVLVRNAAEPADSSLAPTLVPDLRIGVVEGAPEYQFSRITDVDEGARGEIYVLDAGTSNVRVFDPGGTYLRTIGREGEGPGEFTRPTDLRVVTGDTLLVLEGGPQGGRLHVFAPDGSFERTHTVPPSFGSVADWTLSRTGEVFVEVSRRSVGLPDLLLRLDPMGVAADTVAELLPAVPRDAPIAYGPAPKWTLLDDDRIAIARSDEYRFMIGRAGEAVARVVTFGAPPIPIPDDVKARALESARTPDPRLTAGLPPAAAERIAERERQRGLNTTVADNYPYIFELHGGPRGSLWAMRFPQERAPDEPWDRRHPYEVFDGEGRHQGSVRILASFPGPWWRGENLYQIVRDDLGVAYLERVRIEWAEGG